MRVLRAVSVRAYPCIAELCIASNQQVGQVADLAEAIPRPSHALSGIYVAAWRYKNLPDPNQFRLQFWQRQAGKWKLVSFDEKHRPTCRA